MDWLLSAGEGGTRRGCWEATEVGGRWGGRIFSAINCSLILLIRTRLSSWWGEGSRGVGQGAQEPQDPQPPPRAPPTSICPPSSPKSPCPGGGVGWCPTWLGMVGGGGQK